jgi:hypothetical protein
MSVTANALQTELAELRRQIETLTNLVQYQQTELAALKSSIPNSPKSGQPGSVSRRKMLRGLAAGLMAGVAGASVLGAGTAEAKVIVGAGVGAIVLLPGATTSGALPANKVGLFATTNASTDLSAIPAALLGANTSAIVGYATGANRGVTASTDSGVAIYAKAGNNGIGVYGEATQSSGVYGKNEFGAGVTGNSTNGVGVDASSTSGNAIAANSVGGLGLDAYSTNKEGVRGKSFNSRGLVGESENGVPLRLVPGAFNPGSGYTPLAGDIYVGTGANANRLFMYNGASWLSVIFS